MAFWPVVSGDRSFFQLDLRYEHVPIWHAVQQALRSGESPFWIEGQYCGNPLLFTQEAPLFYPLTVPLLMSGAPPHRLADLFSLFHFWLAGFAGFLFLRDRGCDGLSALFGGMAWMLSARMTQSSIWPNAVAVMALLPLLLLGFFRVADGRRRSGVLWAAISGGLCLLASRPQALLGAAPLLGTVAIAAVLTATEKIRVVRDLAVAGVLAAALGAPSVLPSAAVYPESSRAGGLSKDQRDLKPLTSRENVDQVFLPTDGPHRWPEAAAYPGVLVALLFVVGILFGLRRGNGFDRCLFWSMALGGAIGLLFAFFGERGPLGLLADLPLMRGFRVPARYLTSWSLALAMGSAFVLSLLGRDSRRRKVLAGLCLAALSFDLTLHARRSASTAPSALYAAEPDLVLAVRPMLTNDESGFPRRFWSLVLPPFLWMYPDAQKLFVGRRFEPLYGALGMSYDLEAVTGSGPPLRRWKLLFAQPGGRVAELAGAGALILPAPSSPQVLIGTPQPFVVRRVSGLPRAIVVPEAIVVPPSQAIAATLADRFDPRRAAILEDGPGFKPDPGWTANASSVQLIGRGAGHVELAATVPADGILVVFNTFEEGWRATVDGKPQPVLVADAAFQGVRLPRGDHVVKLRYRPRGLAAGIVAAAVGVLGLVICAFRMPP